MEKLSQNGNQENLEIKIINSFGQEEGNEIISEIPPNKNKDSRVVFKSETKDLLKESMQKDAFYKEDREEDIEKELKEKHKCLQEIEDHVDRLDSYADYKVSDLISGKEYRKMLKARKPKPEKKTEEGPLKVGKMRVARDHKDKELLKEIKDAGLKEKDYSAFVEKLKKTIAELENAAKKIEEDHDFSIKELSNDERERYLSFLFTTNILKETMKFNGKDTVFPSRGLSRKGIDQDEFLNSYDIIYVNSGDAPKSIIDTPMQLVYINKLNKIFGAQFIQETDTNLKFTDIDRSICTFLVQNKPKNHTLTKTILSNMLKKLILLEFSTVESAFRSSNIWIKPEFKSLIKSEIIMMQGLPQYLRNSFNVFVTELLETDNAQIFNRTDRLDYIIHIDQFGIIEQTLARVIKTMSPMFIYDYFECVKSIYLFCGLFEAYLDKLVETKDQKDKQQLMQEIETIAKVSVILYQNTRLYQNSTARSLPYFEKGSLSEQAQMYYLNHTLVGPQYQLLKCFEKAAIALV